MTIKGKGNNSVPNNAITFWGKAWSDTSVGFYAHGHEPAETLPLYIPPFMRTGTLDLSELHFTLLKGCADDFFADATQRKHFRKLPLEKKFGPLFRLSRDVNSIIVFLHNKARNGDQEAARRLFFIAKFTTELLEDLMLENPKALHGFIENQGEVPVMAGSATDWADKANELLSSINFAQHFRGFWHKEKGLHLKAFDSRESPARMFALYCFHILDWNRYFVKTIMDRKNEFIAFLKKEYPKISWQNPPEWALRCGNLPKFDTRKTAIEAWYKAIVSMVDSECPDFYQGEEWHNSWRRKEYTKRVAPSKNIHAYECWHSDFDRRAFFHDLGHLIRKRILEDIRNILPHLAAKSN